MPPHVFITITGSTVFVIILKPGQDPVNDPTISEISEEFCKKINTGDSLSFFSGTDSTVLLPIDGSCIENYDIASATTSSSTKKSKFVNWIYVNNFTRLGTICLSNVYL